MDIESSLLELMPKEELEQELSNKVKQFYGLLTREVALKLIAKERGVLKESRTPKKINELQNNDRMVVLEASVHQVWPTVHYRSGKCSKVVELEDETSLVPLVLWNDDVKLAEMLRSRDKVQVEGAYVKNNELFLGYSGKVTVVNAVAFTPFDSLEEGRRLHFRGAVSVIGGYVMIDGRRIFSFSLSDGTNEARCIIWDGPERGDKIKEGDEVIVENASVRDQVIYLGKDGRMLLRRIKDMLIGKIEQFELQDNMLKVKVGEREAILDRENALQFLHIEAAEDITLDTIVTLKKERMLNSNIAVKIKEDKHGIIML
jgi:hypothetical protein